VIPPGEDSGPTPSSPLPDKEKDAYQIEGNSPGVILQDDPLQTRRARALTHLPFNTCHAPRFLAHAASFLPCKRVCTFGVHAICASAPLTLADLFFLEVRGVRAAGHLEARCRAHADGGRARATTSRGRRRGERVRAAAAQQRRAHGARGGRACSVHRGSTT